MITIEEIKAMGEIPESFYNIKPGKAIFYVPADGVSSGTKQLVLDIFEKCKKQYEGFALCIKVESTSNQFLENTIVAKRLNFGSLYRYNLLIARVNCKESIDAFVKEYFNLTSRDDEALKFINKKKVRPQYYGYEEPSYDPTGMTLEMIVMRPPIEKEDDDDVLRNRTPEQVEDDNRLISHILDYAFKDNEEVALELLERLSPRIYTQGDCKLLVTEDLGFWLKAGTNVQLDLSKREAALYLLLLAHPKGIEKKRISEYKDELADYYFYLHKKPNGDKVDKTIDNLVAIKETGERYKMKALDECTSRINTALEECIMNRTSLLPFKVRNKDGILHVDLPRKYFEWQVKEVNFEIKD